MIYYTIYGMMWTNCIEVNNICEKINIEYFETVDCKFVIDPNLGY